MKKLLLLLAITIATASYSQTAITDSNFQQAINTCLSTNPVDGMCTDSEYGAMPDWNVSQVTDMSYAFLNKNTFNADISAWDVSSVTIMEYMFYSASDFNQPIANWNTSSVADMTGMFGDAESFNQQINAWDTSSATNMSSMFVNAFSFNSFLGHWDVSNVTNMNNMFAFATSFNQELEEYWDVNKVTDCGGFSSESKMKTKPKFTKCNPN